MLVAPVVPTLAPDNRRAGVRPAQNTLAPFERERLAASAGYPSGILKIGAVLRAILRVCHTVDQGHDVVSFSLSAQCAPGSCPWAAAS